MKQEFKFASNQECYDYISRLIQRLNEAGEPAWAVGLKDAMGNGSTGGEVLGNIWLKLKEFEKSDVPKRLGMRDEIRALTKDIGRALKRWR